MHGRAQFSEMEPRVVGEEAGVVQFRSTRTTVAML